MDEHAELGVLQPLDLLVGLLLDAQLRRGDPQREERQRLGEESAAWAGVASVGETAAATVMAARPASTLRRPIGSDKELS
ncbi:hypothetical protein [Streptomyces sp. NPDC001833]|uniref:hypothetical protein n=1 Tax=Streptomyces sp. NPDC001833 TaxID=3154658 RepID=UPI00331E5277